jgi:hypothetical protein
MTFPALPLLATLVALAGAPAFAQTATPASRAELTARVLKLQQPAIEATARGLAEQPAAELMERAGAALQARVAPERREAVGRDIRADVKKYLDEAVPLVQSRAVALAPAAITPLLDDKFTEDELRQLVAALESPALAKFQKLGGDMQKALAERLVQETRATIDPKIAALEQSLTRRLGLGGGSSPKAAPKPAKPASP